MEIIAENEKYVIKVDTSKNRIYYKIIGFWKTVEEVPDFVSDTEKAANMVSSNFSLITDLREAKPPISEVKELQGKTFNIMMKANLGKIAEIVDSAILKMSVSRVAGTDVQRQSFKSLEDAEKWLDE